MSDLNALQSQMHKYSKKGLIMVFTYFNYFLFLFQFYFPCDSWRDISETPSEEISERFRRKAPSDSEEANNFEEK
jgi:hypothetical protein